MSAWQNQPLPPGWEAKFDPGSGRYFFINHQLKETTWVDPRVPKGGSNPSAAPPLQTVTLPPAAAYGSAQAQAQVQQQQAEFNAKVGEIASQFPDAPVDVIRNLMYRCNCNPTLVRQALATNGYQPQSASQSASRRQDDSRGGESSEATDIKRTVPDHEIEAARSKLVSEFKNCPNTLINMALEASDYDLGKTRILIRSMLDDDKTEERRRKKREEEDKKDAQRQEKEKQERERRNRQGAGSRADRAAAIASGPGPVFIADTGADSASSISEESSIARASNIAQAGSIATGPSSAEIYKGISRATEENGREKLQNGAIHQAGAITKASAIHRESEISRATAIANSPAHGMRTSVCAGNRSSDSYIGSSSGGRPGAQGPNPALSQGPNKDLLITNYIAVGGPNPSNRQGPQASNRQGPLGGSGYESMAQGADSSLLSGNTIALGPDASLRNGPNPGLLQGSVNA